MNMILAESKTVEIPGIPESQELDLRVGKRQDIYHINILL